MSFSSFKSFGNQMAIPKLLNFVIIMVNEFFENESFEKPVISNQKTYSDFTKEEKEEFKWFSAGNSGQGVVLSKNDVSFEFPTFITGEQAVAIQKTGFMEQEIYLNIGTYTFSTYFISRNGTQNNPIQISINDEIITTIDKVVTKWTLFTHTFNILKAGDKTLRLEGTSEQDKTTGIDLVALSRKTITYTPVSNLFTSANLTINNSIEPSKIGDYIVSHSSDQGFGKPYNAFNGLTTDSAFISGNNYDGSGIHNGSFSTTTEDGTSYIGDWLQIKLPSSILLKRYEIMGRFGSTRGAFMKEWYLLGSNDDDNDNEWYLIDSQNILSRDYWQPYYDNKLPSNFNVSPTKSFSNYRVVINSAYPLNRKYESYVGVAQLNLYSNDETMNSNFENLLVNKPPYAYFRAEDYDEDTDKIPAKIGNFTADVTLCEYFDEEGNGAGDNVSIPYLQGNVSSRVHFRMNVPLLFTMCSISRFIDNNPQGRIITASGGNMLHGHNLNSLGMVHYNKFMTTYNGDGTNVAEIPFTDWLVMCGKNNSIQPRNFLANNIPVGTEDGGDGGYEGLGINNRNDQSGFAFNKIFVWDSVLTDDEMQTVSEHLMKYLKDGLD